MTIRAIYTSEPSFPVADQHPDAVRYQIGNLWIDAIGGEPSQAEIDAIMSPATSTVDASALNAVLTDPGSVVRALGLVVFDIAKGTIPVNPSYTMAQYVNLLKARMR